MEIIKIDSEENKNEFNNKETYRTDYDKYGFNEYGDVLTVIEAAECLKISRITLQKIIDSGMLHYIRIGNMIRIPRYSILVFLGLIDDELNVNS